MKVLKKNEKIFFISFFISFFLLLGFISLFFVYPDRMQNFIVESLNLKTYLNDKVQNFIAKKINNKSINVNIEKIKFLKPDSPNIAKIELSNIKYNFFKQKRNQI